MANSNETKEVKKGKRHNQKNHKHTHKQLMKQLYNKNMCALEKNKVITSIDACDI